MATFQTGGIAATMAQFDRLAKATDSSIEKAVKAGGKKLAERLKDAAPVDTGALRDAIKAGPVRYNAGDGYHTEVGPGTAKHPATGEPLGKIGNILEYGRSNMAPRPWFAPTVAANEGEVLAAMEATFKQEQGG